MALSGDVGTMETDADLKEAIFTMLDKNHRIFLETRALNSNLVASLGISTGKNGNLCFDFIKDGITVNHKYRSADKKFWMDEGHERPFWNQDVIGKFKTEPLVITEGEFDGIACIQAGYSRTVSVPNGANSNLEFLAACEQLEDVTSIILATDDDSSGRILRENLARILGRVRCNYVEFPDGCKDANDVLLYYGEEGLRQCLSEAKLLKIKGLYKPSQIPPQPDINPLETEWDNINPLFRPFQQSFCVVTGIPGAGKSKWTTHLACSLARQHGQKIAIASFEMNTGVILEEIRDYYQSFHDSMEGVDAWLDDHFAFIADDELDFEEPADVDWVLKMSEAAVIRHGVQWLVIDPWNQIDHNYEGNSAEYQRKQIKKIKSFCRRRNVGVIVVAHPTKDVKNPRTGEIREVSLYDIDGSSHWVNAADQGVSLTRPDHADNKVKVTIKKVRYAKSGICGEAWLYFGAGRYLKTVAPTGE